jgi:hypothetical protein
MSLFTTSTPDEWGFVLWEPTKSQMTISRLTRTWPVDRLGHSAVKCCRAFMANALGKRKAERNRLVELVLLFVIGVPVSVLLFWVADELRLGTYSAFGAFVGLVFLWAVGRGYRSKFGDPAFIAFFIAWLAVHVTVFLLVLKYLGFLYYYPVVLLEAWVGYTLAIQRFGPPTRSK